MLLPRELQLFISYIIMCVIVYIIIILLLYNMTINFYIDVMIDYNTALTSAHSECFISTV